jgi:hypothetical protein
MPTAMRSDIEIAQAATLQRVSELAQNQLGISDDHLYAYGHHKAKLSLKYIEKLPARKTANSYSSPLFRPHLQVKARPPPLLAWAMHFARLAKRV